MPNRYFVLAAAFAVVATCLFTVGCGKSDEITSSHTATTLKKPPEVSIDSLLPIDSRVQVQMTRLRHCRDTLYRLTFRTERIYAVSPNRIVAELSGQGRPINVTLRGLNLCSGLCLDMFSPAEAVFDVNLPVGRVPLHVEYNGQKDIYQLIVSAEGVTIHTVRSSFTAPLPPKDVDICIDR
jgi:hypothetical protein